MSKQLGIAAIILLSLVSGVACTTADQSAVRSAPVSRSSFTGVWPVAADVGVLACDSFRGHAVTFTPTGSDTTYALSPTAMSWATQQRWAPRDAIATGDSWADLIRAGNMLCG